MTGGTGSYPYMAGEVYRRLPYNAKADVYSLAMVMYELLSGRRPFAEMDARDAMLLAVRSGLRPQWPRAAVRDLGRGEAGVLARAQTLTERCWAGQPEHRCQPPHPQPSSPQLSLAHCLHVRVARHGCAVCDPRSNACMHAFQAHAGTGRVRWCVDAGPTVRR